MAISRADIQHVRSLGLKRDRYAHGQFIAEGVKVVSELIESPFSVDSVYATDPALLSSLSGDFERKIVSEKEMERISQLTTPGGLLAVARIPAASVPVWDDDLILALDGIRDPGNLGTIIRTALWFGVTQVLCSTDCVDAFSPKVVQGAMGALFHATVLHGDLPEWMRSARECGFHTVSAALEGGPVDGLAVSGKVLLVIGSESHGVSPQVRELSDAQVRIPSFGVPHVESLNAAVATGILLSEFR